MKTLFRILIVLSFLAIIFFYSSNSNNNYEPLEGPNSSSPIIPKSENDLEILQEALPRPEQGVSTLIGNNSKVLLEQYGEPKRIDASAYGYEWWVYNDHPGQFIMFAVDEEVITQVYTSGPSIDISPYKIGQSLSDIYRMTIISSEVVAKINDNIYTFTMSEDDMNTRILTKFDDIFAQLYIDSEQGILSGIRYTDSKSLVMLRPYEMSFVGELLSPPNPTSYLIEESNKASAYQLHDLLNEFRFQNNIPSIENDQEVSTLAMQHSEDMYSQSYLSHESPTKGSLKDRLDEVNILYKDAEENIATAYNDSIEAVHGWLNSSAHREYMMDNRFTHVGSGVFINYYTHIFIQKPEEEEKEQIE
ncbi:CAP domain-containing protein [Lysinibacillus antri]|uniref:CAP domain-containing protein n=1 Tax=Lysinibacillus antri TaxID=2498145 RepID=A0A432LFH7_9BACI|nr:CAP domain-containing protein [Lysinibacillus antri]RUL55931.1 hypothetical protein EK386_03695 [Lysinibacillus antri]